MYPGIKEIQVNAQKIIRDSESLPLPRMSEKELKDGIRISANASRLPEEQPITPLAKNGLKWAGDLKPEERLLVGAPMTKFEKWLYEVESLLLLQNWPHKLDHYDTSRPILDEIHYLTDCWLNLNPEKFRDISPDAVKEVNSMIETYMRPMDKLNIIKGVGTPGDLALPMELLIDMLPGFVASKQMVETSLPFMTKHTNCGYPTFLNDRTSMPHSNDTAATYNYKLAEPYQNNPKGVVLKYGRIFTEFIRFQRMKGRLILASSRAPNLVFSQAMVPLIDALQEKSPLYRAGYNNTEVLRQVLYKMADDCLRNGLVAYNLDYHRFDAHYNSELKALIGGLFEYLAKGSRSKDLMHWMAVNGYQGIVVAGTMKRTAKIFGRILSGENPTNIYGGAGNALCALGGVIAQDPAWVRDVYNKCSYPVNVIGDDLSLIVKPDFSQTRFSSYAWKRFRFEIDDPAKNAFGIKFVQFRVYERDGARHMIYPFPRVVKSMLFKERAPHLGEAGHTFAFYQQLSKLVDDPKYLSYATNIAAYLDDCALHLDTPVEKLIAMTKEEDKERLEKMGPRSRSTADALFDGDPAKSAQFRQSEDKLELDPGYFQDVQAKLRAVYDPKFFQNHSLPTLAGKQSQPK